jgi:hypothetical protein
VKLKGQTQAIFDAEAKAEADASKRAYLLDQLDALDKASIRALRAKATGKSKKADDDTLAGLDAQADALRAQLAAIGEGA